MRQILLAGVSITFTLISMAASAEDLSYTLVSPVPFAENSGASSDVKGSCSLETRLPTFIEDAAKRGVKVVISPDPGEDVAGKVLYLEFTNVLGTGGGAWSGPKSVTVRGELKENGELIGSFTASRYSSGGAFAGFKGTCDILGRCIKTLGKDIADWLKKPTMNAMLGNA
ncbi:MAG: hypothetical protein OEM60_06710 [Gammaproteobacteria bacterium]|nr:hypothetical protein [Gammaproteobacteria bacterium]MDH3428631.1 hypothetical protein [Gammaproteobacteria bacterium]MDH3433531.1 hypothetical protein [Gammaproteobacteria bacterium]